jgi:hypothetical protein
MRLYSQVITFRGFWAEAWHTCMFAKYSAHKYAFLNAQ